LPFVHTVDESRNYILEYSRVECESNTAKPRLPYRETFLKALQGDSAALRVVFTDENYHSSDLHWDKVPWHILHVVGDGRFAAFVSKCTPDERRIVLRTIGPSVGRAEDELAADRFFREKFPLTYSLWKKDGPFTPQPEIPGVDYGPRRLGQALAGEQRFAEVRLHKSSTNAPSTIVVAPRSLSKRDIADLRRLIRKHLADKGVLELR
jgi:hypothetical protein